MKIRDKKIIVNNFCKTIILISTLCYANVMAVGESAVITLEFLQNAQNLDRLCREKWSSFDKIYLNPDGRQEHITFTQNLLKQLVAALKDRAIDINPILNLLLQD